MRPATTVGRESQVGRGGSCDAAPADDRTHLLVADFGRRESSRPSAVAPATRGVAFPVPGADEAAWERTRGVTARLPACKNFRPRPTRGEVTEGVRYDAGTSGASEDRNADVLLSQVLS